MLFIASELFHIMEASYIVSRRFGTGPVGMLILGQTFGCETVTPEYYQFTTSLGFS